MLKKDDVKDIVKLKDKEKLTYQEIANKFNANPSTIFYRYKLGKERYPETFKENSKNLQNISKINLENPKNSLRKDEENIENNPLPKIIRRVENPKNWRKKDNPLEKKTSLLKEKDNFLEEKGKGRRIKIKHNSNWLFLVVVASLIAFITYMMIKNLKNEEGGGGQKIKEPQQPISPITPSIPEGREWAQ